MKLAELDWEAVLAELPRWERLSVEARRAFLRITPGIAISPDALGAAADELVAEGMIFPPGPRGTNYPHAPEVRPLLSALRAMHRTQPLGGAGGRLPQRYLQDQFTIAEVQAFASQGGFRYWADHSQIAALASSVDWVKSFLDAGTGAGAARWAKARQKSTDAQPLGSPAVARSLRELVEALAGSPAGAPLGTLDALLPNAVQSTQTAALAAGLRYLLVFASLDDRTLEARIGLLPNVIRKMGPPPSPPSAVEVSAAWDAPFRLTDMTTVLVDAAVEPLPVRGSDGGLYVRTLRALTARLLPVPAWVEDFLLARVQTGAYVEAPAEDVESRAELRITGALNTLSRMDFAEVKKASERYQLSALPPGRAWLALGEGERLKQVLDAVRGSAQRNPGDWSIGTESVDFFGTRFGFSVAEDVDLRTSLAAAFLSIPAGEWVEADPFIQYYAESANPLLDRAGPLRHRNSSYGASPSTREAWEEVWAQVLLEFLRQRLVPLGGARLGRGPGGTAFTLTDAGRYLLGATDTFSFAAPTEGDVLVKPDFEIVFLAPAPRLEAEFGRFAERTGSGVGTLFRITRASVLRAAEQGLAADAMLKTLGAASRTPVPANVARQIKDWFGATRRVRVRPAVLVECPDTETAARVAALGGEQVTAITRTVLRLDGDPRFIATLTKKLRALGIFVQS
ncbi:helicase-associated domain-containing protein [Longimicrobium terrae]|uniref:Helicase XPB/Ssl2 N-terminal domain-containing protein n=1 Tax=Longimicrobium terrae TaxID=1639882 RepID=A0A841H710_9BACT|nr:helicase-associated domain-containing protein [Longimicrobium terrae]MBB4639239.1 hypothetical protein [Longimicrobium terrae]MBB6073479.1 hypothetical protein [Longimicrobium terrae]NNC32271.1 hypothetical protein [Longimicrobium terrae]